MRAGQTRLRFSSVLSAAMVGNWLIMAFPHSDKVGGLKGSTQHWLAVYLPGFEIPRFVVAGY
jgi:hypothetical protein